jgi:hypothetical protein
MGPKVILLRSSEGATVYKPALRQTPFGTMSISVIDSPAFVVLMLDVPHKEAHDKDALFALGQQQHKQPPKAAGCLRSGG